MSEAGKDGNVTLTVPAGATGATVVNLMEKPEGAALDIAADHITVPVSRSRLQTIRVAYAPSK